VKTQESLNWFTQFCGVEPLASCRLDNYEGQCPVGHLLYKKSLSLRSFLVYVSRTYRCLVPYLKGLHLSIDSWPSNRDEDGWRTTNTYKPRFDFKWQEAEAPKYVKFVPRWHDDLVCLLRFALGDKPP